MNLTGIHFGQLDVRVRIEEPTVETNSVTGEKTITSWTEVTRIWAKRLSASDEKFEANQMVALNSSAYMIRFNDDIDETMRVNDGEEYHYIKGIERVDRKQYMMLKTEKRDNG
jgi:SPP1 family predicted phage head-tail adaptor